MFRRSCWLGLTWTVIQLIAVNSHTIQKRQVVADDETGDIQKAFEMIGMRREVDLILVMDRSHTLSKEAFYLQERKLAQAILKQHATLGTSFTRLAIITFAQDIEVRVNSITHPDISINKCVLFNGNETLWDRDIRYTNNSNFVRGTNLKDAFIEARRIFQDGKRHRDNTTKVIIVFTDGKYTPENDPINIKKELTETLKVTIFAVGMGAWLEVGNVRLVTTILEDGRHAFGLYKNWQDSVIANKSHLVSYNKDTPQEWIRLHGNTCNGDVGCGENSDCYCDVDRGHELCRCKGGYGYNKDTGLCEACAVNTYKPEAGNDPCIKCPPGTERTSGKYQCTCPANSSCSPDPCETAGCNQNQNCIVANDTHAYCVCKEDRQGDDCSENVDACKTHAHLCKSGVCVDGSGKDVFTCVCTNWVYTGRYCETNQNECTSDMCMNNSTCSDLDGNFRCNCVNKWIGRYCQDLERIPTTTTTTTTTTAPPTTITPKPAEKEDKTILWIIIGASVGGGLLLIIIIITVACCVCNKRKQKNEQEVKNIAQQFSGFWKKRTIRGSKYVKELEEDNANGGLPSAPVGHRPDLIENTNEYTPTETFKTDEYAEIPYETVTMKTGMESWQNYITELEMSSVIESALIVKLTGDKKAKTTAWLYDPSEQDRIQTLMEEQDDNVPLLLQDGEYHIQENDGTLAVGRTFGSSQDAKCVAIGKTKTYLIVAIALAENDAGKARKEVQWIVDHISGEGY